MNNKTQFLNKKNLQLTNIIDIKNGRLLEGRYEHKYSQITIECEKKHNWETKAYIIISGCWCPYCSNKRINKEYINDMYSLAKLKEGLCLSTEYLGDKKKLKWQCKEGHIWEAAPKDIKCGGWCSICSDSRYIKKYNIHDMHNLAKNKNGLFLSSDFTVLKRKYEWECEKGHKWEANASEIKIGGWCPYCSNRRINKEYINDMHTLAKLKGGLCLSEEYFGDRKKLKWQCKEGHIWEAKPGQIKKGGWCRTCFDKNEAGKHLKLKDGLEQAQNIAKLRLGECLSLEYINSTTKMNWKCANGHTWYAFLSDIKRGSWCPECLPYVREQVCRTILEDITGFKFPKKKFDWLVNSRGNKMELDGYSNELCLAFEHHGEYHYKIIPHFQRDEEKLERRMEDDKTKRDLCGKNNINLLEIDYSIKIEDIPLFLTQQLKNLYPHLVLNEIKDINKIKFAPSLQLSKLKIFVEKKGGKLLSTVYQGVTTKHLFECENGHQWEALPSNILNGKQTWCPTCKPDRIGRSNQKYEVKDMQELAKSYHGYFLSDIFKSVNHYYKWKCKNNHEWSIRPSDIFKGNWCAKCKLEERQFIKLNEMKLLAISRNGKCLSESYLNNNSKLLWECEKNHQWLAVPNNVKNGSWCPFCRKKFKQ